ncbi:hypothetical protein FKM82_009741 [Ascaphus truei]
MTMCIIVSAELCEVVYSINVCSAGRGLISKMQHQTLYHCSTYTNVCSQNPS